MHKTDIHPTLCHCNATVVNTAPEFSTRRAQTRSRVARELIPLGERAAFSASEFAALCGRSPTWAYRQIYGGRIKPIAGCGRLLIARSELDSFLHRKAEYNPSAVGGVQ